MLYISTRNNVDSYTAHRALHEAAASDGGLYTPFRPLTPNHLSPWKDLSTCDAIALVLNCFFGRSLSGWDIDCAIGRTPFQTVELGRRTTVIECWRNPGGNWNDIVERLYAYLRNEGSSKMDACGWARVAIEIAMLFGLFVQADLDACERFDLCVSGGDFATVAAALYAKDMGLPIGKILCVCNENGSFWDLIHRGEMNTGVTPVNTRFSGLDTAKPMYFEYLLHRAYGTDVAMEYVNVCRRNGVFRLNEELLPRLSDELLATVVSTNRMDAVISSIYRTNRYIADPILAFTYGGLQDYRASSGIGNHTLLLGKENPATYADRLTEILNLSKYELTKQINSTKE